MGGGLFAGYITTRTAVLAGPGWDVVEAQCLLTYTKMAPGIVGGVYGQQTIAAAPATPATLRRPRLRPRWFPQVPWVPRVSTGGFGVSGCSLSVRVWL